MFRQKRNPVVTTNFSTQIFVDRTWLVSPGPHVAHNLLHVAQMLLLLYSILTKVNVNQYYIHFVGGNKNRCSLSP